MVEKLNSLRAKYEEEASKISAEIEVLQANLLLTNAKISVVDEMLADAVDPSILTVNEENY